MNYLTITESASHLKQKCEGFCKRLKVVDIIESRTDFHIFEQGNAEDGKDEHYEKKQQCNIDLRKYQFHI